MAISRNATISQIAELANVSIATASRVINQPGSVRPETRNRVLQVMKDLNYKVKREENKMILASFPSISNPFYNEIIDGMQTAARRRGYQLLLQQLGDVNTPDAYDFLLNNQIFAGIIFTHLLPNSEIRDSILTKYPIVMCSQYHEALDLPTVIIDDYAAAQSAVNYLLSIGKRQIALINSGLNHSYAVLREKAYLDTLDASGIPTVPGWIIHIPEVNLDAAYSAALNLLSASRLPDAVFCTSDVYACAVIKAAHQLGILVPSDIAVMGFDNIELSNITVPSISTVSQPTYQLGFQSSNLLIDQIEGSPVVHNRITLSTEIVVRCST